MSHKKADNMLFFDNHTHTTYSPDGKMSIREAVESAVSSNLGGIAISDHYDIDIPGERQVFTFDIEEREMQLLNIRSEYEDKIEILNGIELGMQPHCMEDVRRLSEHPGFDSIIASIHFIEKSDPYFGEYYIGKEKGDAYRRYFETMFGCMKALENFDILGHFDYIARYAPYKDKQVTYREFGDHLDTIFRYLSGNGKVLEINTKSYNTEEKHFTVLDENIIRRYAELGGEAVSLGSDAHRAERIGEDFRKYAELSKKCGIKYICRFKNRKAEYFRL